MKRISFLVIIILLACQLFAQEKNSHQSKIFWKEDFSEGSIPKEWTVKAVNDSGIVWVCTNQPFPGSAGHDQQAPPIASKSGGFHMQIAPGVRVDKNYRRWKKNNAWTDAYFQTSAIDCSGKKSVVLKFQQNFKYNNWGGLRKDAGLYVGISNNGTDWKDFDVRNGIESEGDCPNPMDVELNITAFAAGQKTVYLRFYWKGIYGWYWMIDDLELTEALDKDLMAYKLASHPVSGNNFGSADVFKYKVVNLSANDLAVPFDCFLQVDNRPVIKVTEQFNKEKQFKINDTLTVSFPPSDLTDYGIHNVKFYTSLPGDERTSNDTLSAELYSKAYELGPVTSFKQSGSDYIFSCNHAIVKVRFYRNDIFRIMMSYNGIFTDPVGNEIVINQPADDVKVNLSDMGDYYLMKSANVALRAYKNPLRFAMYKGDNSTPVWEEVKGLTYGEETVQSLKRGADEYFYGGGMQNGRFSHRDKTIKLTIDYNWNEGGNPNPAPFYMSTSGYGALRNTFAPGEYAFKDTVKLSHSEARFDCYYFAGSSLKQILNAYTDITGKPFLPPRWALSLGDANCYNRGANKNSKNTTGFKGLTPDVITLIADKYIQNDMPRGWILPNDGYGCGYTKLDSVIVELHKRGFYTGLWTENGVAKIAREVGQLGSRLCKLDVAWIGNGYKFALDGCREAYQGIENNSDARGFVWSVCGWAGTQRNSVIWTGDQSGNWDYIRWHIPTIVGSGLSGFNYATGDVDGIFGGSDKTYTRDLQWKCFTPAFMGMSGWAPKDKQPYIYGEPYTSINRKYLKLKMRLTPYMYTLCDEAYKTGVPAVRGLVLEYPDDTVARGTETQYEFLLGTDFLVAPVYRDEAKRDSIYFPKGKWIDYWDGTVYEGNTRLNNYPAPLDKLPLFVRAGAVIPMYQQMMYDGQMPADTLTLDIYPGGRGEFNLYEDDGLTREHRSGAFASTLLYAQSDKEGRVTEAGVNAVKGDYKGKLLNRAYVFQIHSSKTPKKVTLLKKNLKKFTRKEDFAKAKRGWFFDAADRKGIILIKTAYLPTSKDTRVNLSYR